jgi:hypothetical protein
MTRTISDVKVDRTVAELLHEQVAAQRGAVLTQARKLVEFARQHGYGRAEPIQMITDLPHGA